LQRIKQIAMTGFLFVAAFWLAFKPTSPEMKIECTVIIFVGLISGVCTMKILALINKNTKAILGAIGDMNRK
jgi:hypothetical protein